jgi:hypothetical protein
MTAVNNVKCVLVISIIIASSLMSDIPSPFPLGSRAGSYLRRVPPACSRVRLMVVRSSGSALSSFALI